MTTFPLLAGRKKCFGFFFVILAFFFSPSFLPSNGYAAPQKKLSKKQLEAPVEAPDTDSKEPERKVTLPASEEKIDQEIARLQSRLREIRSRAIPSAGEGTNGKRNDMAAALPEEVAEWRRLNFELIYLIEGHLNALQDLKEIRKANDDRAVERNEWQGFAEKPPFPVSFLEHLYDAIKDKQFERNMVDARREISEGQLREYLKDLEHAGAELRLAEERIAAEKEEENVGRALWQRDLAMHRYELAEAGALSLETQRLVLGEYLSGLRVYIPFLERRYELAASASPLSRADLDGKLQELESPRKNLNEQLNRALGEEEAANQALEKARDMLHRAQKGVPPGKDLTPFQRKELELLKIAQEAQKARLDTSRLEVEIYKETLRLLTVEQQVWEDRYRLPGEGTPEEIRKLSGETRQTLEHIRLWKNSLEDGLDKLAPLLRTQREKFSSEGLSKGEEQVSKTFVAAYAAREMLYRQALKALNRAERVMERWEGDLVSLEERLSKGLGITAWLNSLSSPVRAVWNAELYVAEESAIVDHRKISRPISVTVGKIAEALLILLLGILAAGWLKKPVERIAARWFNMDDSGIKRIGRKWSFFTFIGLFAFALASVNIPWAVFAFLGGTLAIAAGFGAQNLIGNFISSGVLLFNPTIQVGDVVEIEGYRGRVTYIGMLNTLIMRFDGVEMLVPNSQFLEQRVTNWTHSNKHVRYEISVGVAYRSPTQKVSELILKVVKDDPHTMKDPAPIVFLEEFGDSVLVFQVYLWLVLGTEQLNRVALSDIRHRIKQVLDEAGIEMAFPQRDGHQEASSMIPVTDVGDEMDWGEMPRLPGKKVRRKSLS
jgi:potassium-dependent mechanosensitive channel